jgi:hypothetical protein
MNTKIFDQTIARFPITDTQPMEGMALLQAVGNTPLLPLRRVTAGISPNVQVYAKAEWFNPGGSVKDRPAFNIIRSAVNECGLLPGMRLLDSTSGNMGIAYATFGAALEIPITLVLPENVSPERKAKWPMRILICIFTPTNMITLPTGRLITIQLALKLWLKPEEQSLTLWLV